MVGRGRLRQQVSAATLWPGGELQSVEERWDSFVVQNKRMLQHRSLFTACFMAIYRYFNHFVP